MGESILSRNGIPVSGGTITGSLKFMRGGRIDEPLKVHYHSSSGNNIVIGAGGLTVIGGGESADNLYNALDPSSLDMFAIEQLHLASDTTISLHTNCQTIGSRKTVVIDKSGNIAAPGGFSGNASSATKLATARKIGNANFDGTAAISLAQIGAAAVDHTHDIVAMGAGRTITGSYTGQSETTYDSDTKIYSRTTRFISLGATPKAVMIFGSNGSTFTYAEGHWYGYGGVAVTGKPATYRYYRTNYGYREEPYITIENNGFTVVQTSIVIGNGNWLGYLNLDLKDMNYTYIALI